MLDLRFSEAELEARREHIVSFVEDTVADAPVDGAVLGLSGGVDSSLMAYLAVEALGPGGLHGLVMPGTHTSEENVADAEAVAEDVGIAYDVIDVQPLVKSFVASYPAAEGDRGAVANTRTRVRAVFNYLVANHRDRIVLGTGNRSEQLTGKFCRYGDGAVTCHPVGNLYKAQVRQLARHVGVPERIVEKAPTAELEPDQTDEEELGIDYDTLDAILALHVDGPLSAHATASLLDVDEGTVEYVDTLYEHNEYKRQVAPSPERP